MSDSKAYRAPTKLIHGKHSTEKWDYNYHVVPPKTASTTFRLASVLRGKEGFIDFGAPWGQGATKPTYIYDRLTEPSTGMLEEVYVQAEGGDFACAFSCGMAAISASLMAVSKAGDNVVAHPTMYGCTYSLLVNQLPRFGITPKLVNCSDLDAVAAALDENTSAVYLETPANPTLECIDIAAVRKVIDAHNAKVGPERKVRLIVDNTFHTFWGQRPLQLGADIVVCSLTKGVGGFGVDMGGMIVGPKDLDLTVRLIRKDFGGVLPPSSAWNFQVYGIPTMPIRLTQQAASAMKIAQYLESNPLVGKVNYPGLESYPGKEIAKRQMTTPNGDFFPGSMIYFELAGDYEQASKRCHQLINHIADNAYSITLAVSLGMTKTLVEAPGLMTHSALDQCAQEKAGIHPGAVRLSIGLEDVSDLLADLERAFSTVE